MALVALHPTNRLKWQARFGVQVTATFFGIAIPARAGICHPIPDNWVATWVATFIFIQAILEPPGRKHFRGNAPVAELVDAPKRKICWWPFRLISFCPDKC